MSFFTLLVLSTPVLSNHFPLCTLGASNATAIGPTLTSAVQSAQAQTQSAPAPTSNFGSSTVDVRSTGFPVGAPAPSGGGGSLTTPGVIGLSVSLGIFLPIAIVGLVWFGLRRCRRTSRSLQREEALAALAKSESRILNSDSPHSGGPPSIRAADIESVDLGHHLIGSEKFPSKSKGTSHLVLAHISKGRDEEFHPGVRELVENDALTKQALSRMAPGKQKAGSVNDNYNPLLDQKRPENIEEYLRDYRIVFVIDDSTSMRGSPWNEAREALSQIAKYALKFHFRSVDIRFFNSPLHERGIRGVNRLDEVFGQVTLKRGTPTGAVLKKVLDEQINRLDTALAAGASSYSSESPLDIIVITDGVPDADSPPAPVIEAAAQRMRERRHHQNAIGIQFVQIGNNPAAEPTLRALIHGDNNDMVDTVPYSAYQDEDDGRLTAAVLERIVFGGLHPSLRAYYNQYELLRGFGNHAVAG